MKQKPEQVESISVSWSSNWYLQKLLFFSQKKNRSVMQQPLAT